MERSQRREPFRLRATGGTSDHKLCRQRYKTQVHLLTPGDQECDLILCGIVKLCSWDDLG